MCALMLLVSGPMLAQVRGQEPAEHALLQREVGTWDAEIRFWTPGQEANATTVKGTETSRMVGDYWLLSDFEYEMDGTKYQGHGVLGYDPQSAKYVFTWHASDSPYPMKMSGEYDAASKSRVMQLEGQSPTGDPVTGKTVTTYRDERTRVFEMYFDMGEPEPVKWMEITYTKRAASDNVK
jgi:hypothetical protein